jgi:hypothetical protein
VNAIIPDLCLVPGKMGFDEHFAWRAELRMVPSAVQYRDG